MPKKNAHKAVNARNFGKIATPNQIAYLQVSWTKPTSAKQRESRKMLKSRPTPPTTATTTLWQLFWDKHGQLGANFFPNIFVQTTFSVVLHQQFQTEDIFSYLNQHLQTDDIFSSLNQQAMPWMNPKAAGLKVLWKKRDSGSTGRLQRSLHLCGTRKRCWCLCEGQTPSATTRSVSPWSNLWKSLSTTRTSSQYIARRTNIYSGLHVVLRLQENNPPSGCVVVFSYHLLSVSPINSCPHYIKCCHAMNIRTSCLPISVATSGCVVVFSCHLLSVSPNSSCPHCIKCRHAINIRTSCLPISVRHWWFQCVPKEKASQWSLQE